MSGRMTILCRCPLWSPCECGREYEVRPAGHGVLWRPIIPPPDSAGMQSMARG